MTAYVTIPNTSIETGKPIRAVDGRALRDNTTAMAEGASGAPKIVGTQGPVVGTGGLYDSSVTTAKLASNERISLTNVLSLTTTIGAGAVGSYTLASYGPAGGFFTRNSTTSGSNLYNYDTYDGDYFPCGFSGTWRAIGSLSIYANIATRYNGTILWFRVA